MLLLSPTINQREFISARIAAFDREVSPVRRWLEPYVREHQALPLYSGWTRTIGIRSSGELVEWSTETEWSGSRPLDDFTWEACALVRGASRYPELQSLVPPRPSTDAVTCTRCEGRGVLFPDRPELDCECGNLGWVLLPSSASGAG